MQKDLSNAQIIEAIAEALHQQGAAALSQLLKQQGLDLSEKRQGNLRSEIKRSGFFWVSSEAATKDDIHDLWLKLNEYSEGYSYEEYLALQAAKKQASVSQNIHIGGNVTNSPIGQQINQGIQSRDFRPSLKAEYNEANSNANPSQNSSSVNKTIWQYVAWIATIGSAILAYWKFFHNRN